MNKIIFITGGAGSGKTTISRKLAEHFSKSIHIQVDHLREMMVNGIELPGSGEWTDEFIRQFQWARSTTIYMAQLYAREGVDVVIDDVCVPEEFPKQYDSLFGDPDVKKILLLPSAEALIGRLKKRNGPYDEFLIQYVPTLYSYLVPMPKDGWIVLDTGNWTVEQTVSEVLSRVT